MNTAADAPCLRALGAIPGGTSCMQPITSISFTALLRAAEKCACGVRWKDSAREWVMPSNILSRVYNLHQQLVSGKYRLSPYYVFNITEPKPRVIRSPRFRDRVVQRAMCDNGLYHDLMKDAIYDSCACQVGKGTAFADKRIRTMLHRHWQKHGTKGWILRLDIHKFFDSIPHDRLHALIDHKVTNPEHRLLMHGIVDSFPGDRGLGLGCQASQLLANAYLSGLDHCIKERLGFRNYLRYSDDMVIIDMDKDRILAALRYIGDRLMEIGLELNPKSGMCRLSDGMCFMKKDYGVSYNGRIRVRAVKSAVRRFARYLRTVVDKVRSGADPRHLADTMQSWTSHMLHGDNAATIARMRKLTCM